MRVVPYDWSTYLAGSAMLICLIAVAALLGWLAAGLFLRATRPRADASDHTLS
jgi:hypothetical protein